MSPARRKPAVRKAGLRPAARRPKSEVAANVRTLLAELERHGKRSVRDQMGPRYGIEAQHAFGVPVSLVQRLARPYRGDHPLALALWETGWYEARLMVAFIADPARLTAAEMDRWCRDFDSWAVVDTLCFHLFDRSPHAAGRVKAWARRKGEFQKRAAFALIACIALHDRAAPDRALLGFVPLIEAAANDERNFVKKAVLWALRALGRRSAVTNHACRELVERLLASPDSSARWIARSVRKELASPALQKRLGSRSR